MNAVTKIFGHYQTYHANGRPLLKYIGIVAAASYVVFYLIRFTRPNPKPYDDLALRLTVVALFTVLALGDRWPARLKKYYLPYSYLALIFCLPFFNVFMSLQRNGGVPAISNCFIALTFLVMVADWRNSVVMLAIGIAAAAGLHFSLRPGASWPPDLLAQIPAYLLILVGGGVFKLSERQIDAEKSRLANSLAASIAHEMRHPLARLKQNLQSMQRVLPQPAGANAHVIQTAGIETLYRSLAESDLALRRGLQVISMTLDEVSAKPMDRKALARLSAAEAAHKAVQEYGYDSEEERACIEVVVLRDFSFQGDETAYLFVLFNLIKNALYYLPRYPEMRITLCVDSPCVRVRDSGPGIPAQQCERLFEPFRSNGKFGGTGLGLAYCQRVMHAFGGSISCESAQGRGTEFTLRFPAARDDAPASAYPHADALGALLAGRRILVVDDDAVLRSATRRKLEEAHAVVDEADSGKEALSLLGSQCYDLLLLDLNMPGLDGYGVAESVRQGTGATPRDVPIIAHTAEPVYLAGVKIRKAGMDGILSKPSTPFAMLQVLRQALQRAVPAALPAPELHGRAILLVDDMAWNRKAVAGHLRLAGMTVTQAAHGEEALRLLHEGQAWGAVVMDITMPGMDGLEATRAIRRGRRFASVPVIGLTAHSDAELLARARAAGMNEILTKPVDTELLFHLLRHWIVTTAAPPAAPARATAPPPVQPEAPARPLLDAERLKTYREIGMFGELVDDCVPAMLRIAEQLQASAARRDLEASLQALHSLLGMSGEAGATALYQLVRRIYVPMVEERRWPDAADWPEQIGRLTRDTADALRSDAA